MKFLYWTYELRECLDPFENPECEAFDVFVNEFLCVGKGTIFAPYECYNVVIYTIMKSFPLIPLSHVLS